VSVLQAGALSLVALGALAVVLTRDTVRLVFVNAIYTLLLAVLFVVLQGPDVALSVLAVGAVAIPLVVTIALDREQRG
jgi:energy-converting hydrogenase B subunit D